MALRDFARALVDLTADSDEEEARPLGKRKLETAVPHVQPPAEYWDEEASDAEEARPLGKRKLQKAVPEATPVPEPAAVPAPPEPPAAPPQVEPKPALCQEHPLERAGLPADVLADPLLKKPKTLLKLFRLEWDRQMAKAVAAGDAIVQERLRRFRTPYINMARYSRRLGVTEFGSAPRIQLYAYKFTRQPFGVALETITHELSHAACDPRVGHGAAWKAYMISCGILNPRTYTSQALNEAHAVTAPPKYTYYCFNGGCDGKANGGGHLTFTGFKTTAKVRASKCVKCLETTKLMRAQNRAKYD